MVCGPNASNIADELLCLRHSMPLACSMTCLCKTHQWTELELHMAHNTPKLQAAGDGESASTNQCEPVCQKISKVLRQSHPDPTDKDCPPSSLEKLFVRLATVSQKRIPLALLSFAPLSCAPMEYPFSPDKRSRNRERPVTHSIFRRPLGQAKSANALIVPRRHDSRRVHRQLRATVFAHTTEKWTHCKHGDVNAPPSRPIARNLPCKFFLQTCV
jgi:hypothetical protein